MKNESKIRPMPLWMSIAFFSLISLILAFGIYVTPSGTSAREECLAG